jgi:hypothetical protein
MMQRLAVVAGISLALAACGGGNEDRAVAACEKAIADKLGDKAFALDAADMRDKTEGSADGIYKINSSVVFEQGQSSESRQTFECRVQFDAKNPSAEPAVVGLTFTW